MRCNKDESNKRNFDIIKKLVSKKFQLWGISGSLLNLKKFSVEGTTRESAKKLLKEALKIEKAGAFSIVLECYLQRLQN